MPSVVVSVAATRRLLLSGLRLDLEGMSLPNPLENEERKSLLLTVCIHLRAMSTSARSRHWGVEVCLVPRPVQQQSTREAQSIAAADYGEPLKLRCN